MARMFVLALAVLLSAAFVGRSAEAACRASDARGTWELFLVWVSFSGAGWTHCTVTLAETGEVRRGMCESTTGRRADVTAGRVRLARNCSVRGSITTGGVIVSTIDHAQVTRDKLAMHGVGHDGDGSIWKLSAVRR